MLRFLFSLKCTIFIIDSDNLPYTLYRAFFLAFYVPI
nr:MAG TPA: Nse4 C-terminal [Caudoviricetes sp.]